MSTALRRSASVLRAGAIAGLLLGAAIGAATAAEPASLDRPEPWTRRVLAIYDAASEPSASSTLIHTRAEMPLNHLGYIIDYRDITDLPDPSELGEYAAVLTWFTYDLSSPSLYLPWAARAADNGTRFIVIGGFGAPLTTTNRKLVERVLRPMGIGLTGDYAESTAGSRILFSDPDLVGFEHALDPVLPPFPIVRRLDPAAPVALEVEAPALEGGEASALITAGPTGAYLPSDFAIHVDQDLDVMQWVVDPFELFARVLGEDPRPVPDTTTVSGRRLFFSAVDGSGWNWDVEIERYQSPTLRAAEVMLDELIKPYGDLPFTVGVVAGDIDPDEWFGPKAAEIAQQIFALPQVEAGSNTATFPYDWAAFESVEGVPEAELHSDGLFARLGDTADWLVGREDSTPFWRSAPRNDDRAFPGKEFSLQTEVAGAINAVQALLPPGKSVALYQWSGDARPFEAAISATRTAGVRNLNGGGARYDAAHPSIGYVSPIGRQAGAERQIYSPMLAEENFRGEAYEFNGGYGDLAETIEATDMPRRLTGIGLHFHPHTAQKRASVDAVRKHLDWARQAALAPLTASRYAAIADGFYSARIERTGQMQWRISDRDALQTVRFDDVAGWEPDIEQSRGVLGATVHGDALYVALDAAVPQVLVTLRKRGSAQKSATGAASLRESRWTIEAMSRQPCRLDFTARGYGAGAFVWEGMEPGLHVMEVRRDGAIIWSASASADAAGELSAVIDTDAIAPVSVSIACGETPTGEPS